MKNTIEEAQTNNWTICPRCVPQESYASAMSKAEASYGEIPASEYLALLNKAKAISQSGPKYNFREDWYIGVGAGGDFSVGYTGRCTVCGFTHNFKHGPENLKKKHEN